MALNYAPCRGGTEGRQDSDEVGEHFSVHTTQITDLEAAHAGARLLLRSGSSSWNVRLSAHAGWVQCSNVKAARLADVASRMERKGIHARYYTPSTSRQHPAYRVYPHLLRYLGNTRNHVRVADITEIR